MSTVLPRRTLEPVEPLRAPTRRRGTPEAETALLYGEHRQRILAFCSSRLGSRTEAEDATQETFAYALRLLRRGVVPETELPWLYTIAFNVCRWKRRTLWRRGRVETTTDVDRLEDVAQAPDVTGDRLRGLAEALATMPANQGRAFVLRELRGLSYKEIAEILSVTESAVATLLFRARASLASRLQQSGAKLSAAVNGISLIALLRRVFRGGNLEVGVAALALTAGTIEVAPHLHAGIAEPPARPPAYHVRSDPGDSLAPSAHPPPVKSGSGRAARPLPPAAAAATAGARAIRPAARNAQPAAAPQQPGSVQAPTRLSPGPPNAATPATAAPAPADAAPPIPPLPNLDGLAAPAVDAPPAVSQASDAVASVATPIVEVAADGPPVPVQLPVAPPPTSVEVP